MLVNLSLVAFLAASGPAAPAPAGTARPSIVVLGPEDSSIDGSRHVWRGDPISLSLKNADLGEVLRTFAKFAGLNLVLDSRIHGEVTVELANVPWDQALYVILKVQGLAAEVDGEPWPAAPGTVEADGGAPPTPVWTILKTSP